MTGIICVNKPKDITSFGVVAKMRGITAEKKAGHTGTLDPMATGVLPIVLGGATKFIDYLPDSDKAYRATFLLGKTTDTLDITGTVLTQSKVEASEKDVLEAMQRFKGKIMQVPPMYSAVSVGGKRLYELARQGVEIERKARQIEIKSISLVSHNANSYVIDVHCSKGTYIRSLVDDIGRELGCGAVLCELVRTSAMGFTLDDCVTLEKLQEIKDNNGSFSDCIFSVETALSYCKAVNVSEAQARRFSNGGALSLERLRKNLTDNALYRVYGNNIFLGLGRCSEKTGELKVERLLTKRD